MTLPPHRVQGLDNDEVAADWPPIGSAEIGWLQRHYPQLQGDPCLLWHSPRPLSAAAIIATPAGKIFVKRHHRSVRSAAMLVEEHRFIQHLAAAGVPVVQLLHDAAGNSAIEQGDWTYELHRVGEGRDPYRDVPSWTPPDSTRHALEAGRMLATLHRASAGYSAPPRSTHILVAGDELIRAGDPIAALERQLAQRPGLAGYLAGKPWQQDIERAIMPFHRRLAGRLQQEPPLWAHNDWHVSNLLWRGEGNAMSVDTVLDFGLASPTSALFDLATAIERNAIAWLQLQHGAEAVRLDIVQALVSGYRSVLALAPARMALLADLLPVVHLDFALSEVEYFHAITGSPANADVAYHTFLLGHAEWFATPVGQALLASLRDGG